MPARKHTAPAARARIRTHVTMHANTPMHAKTNTLAYTRLPLFGTLASQRPPPPSSSFRASSALGCIIAIAIAIGIVIRRRWQSCRGPRASPSTAHTNVRKSSTAIPDPCFVSASATPQRTATHAARLTASIRSDCCL
eukprot:3743383-Rhodomonas_salina.3